MPATSKFVRLTRLQGALLGSFFLHGLLLYGLSIPGGNTHVSSTPQNTVMEVQLLAQAPPHVPVEEVVPSQDTLPVETTIPPQPQVAVSDAPKQPAETNKIGIAPLLPADPKVKQFLELPYPPDTVNISATLEIEVYLDKDGKATDVKVLRESPAGLFTEWAWEMGMQGQYSPKITSSGPVASTLRISLAIIPGMPIEVR